MTDHKSDFQWRYGWKSLIAIFFAIMLIGCSDSGDCHDCGPSLTKEPTFDDEPGDYAVGRKTDVVYRDESRGRDIKATFWYPTEGSVSGPEQATENAPVIAGPNRFPLLVLIHGIVDNAPDTWPWLAPYLASRGYIIVAPSTGATFQNVGDVINHPGDVSFLIDTVSGINGIDDTFEARVDADRIGVAGYSHGGLATYLVTYNPNYQDVRLKAAIIMAGFNDNSPPVRENLQLMTVYGTEDPLAPYTLGLNIFQNASAPKYFVALLGGGHSVFTRSNELAGLGDADSRYESIARRAIFAFLTSVFADSRRDVDLATHFLTSELEESETEVDIMFELPHDDAAR